MARTATLTWGQYRRLIETWTEEYLSAPSAFSIGGRPVCAFLNLSDFVARYGLMTFAVMLRYADRFVEAAIGVRPHLLGVIGQADVRCVRLANALPLDAITGYGLLPNWLGPPRQSYAELIEERVRDWHEMQQRLRVPFYPVVCAGWDATCRGEVRTQIVAEDGYPYSPVVEGVTAELFGEFLDHALAFNAAWQPRENLVFLHAWNEWTECSVIEPSDRFGTTLLEAVHERSASLRTLSLGR